MAEQNIENLISSAKLRLFAKKDWVFMATLCSLLETVITDSIPYGATDGNNLYINPETFVKLTDQEQVFLLAHEALHVAYLHMSRRETRDPELFNMACDFVINLELVNQGFTMIDGGLIDKKYHNMSAEEVYELIKNTASPQDVIGLDLIENTADTTTITAKVIQAVHTAQRADAYGSVPNSIKRFIDELHKPKINWKVVLKRFLLDAGKADYTWNKPNRRLLNQGFYLPSINAYGLSKVTFAIDTSGSVTDKMFTQFISEISYVFKQLNPESIDLMLFDTEVKLHQEVKSINELKKVKFTGCGGTDVTDTINQYNKTNSKALIVITDGYFSKNLPKTNKPIIWVIFDNPNFTISQGKVIHFNLE